MKNVVIFTDGACSGNPGPGGWAAILEYNGIEKEISGAESMTTNNRMELTAAIEALKLLKESCTVDLYSDSKYLVDSMEKGWLGTWKKNNYIRNRKEIPNRDLWEELDRLVSFHRVKFIWVKGHGTDERNNRCDKAAVNEIKKLKKSLPTE